MSNKMALDALTEAQRAINSMKVEAETAGAGGDKAMLQDACEQISNEGLAADAAIRAAIAALQAEPQPDTSILVRLHRPEGYEDVHPELVLEDANINPAFLPELVTHTKD